MTEFRPPPSQTPRPLRQEPQGPGTGPRQPRASPRANPKSNFLSVMVLNHHDLWRALSNLRKARRIVRKKR